MARIHTAGFESGITSSTQNYDGESNVVTAVTLNQVGTISYQSTVARNSGYAMSCAPSASNYTQIQGLTHADGVPMYVRFYFRTNDATPSQTHTIWAWRLGGVVAADIVMNASGLMWLRDANGTAVGSATSALSADTWYRIECSITIPAAGNGALEWRLNGATVASSGSVDVNNALTTTTHRLGHPTAAETQSTVYIDDLAINDGSGADNNSWPGHGNVTLLGPLVDNAVGTGWEGPQTTGSDTTNLYDNVNNVPPTGVAHADTDANAGKYIFNAANLGAASEYRATCLAPIGVLPSNSIITLSQAYMRASTDSASGTNNMELQGITPADTAVTCNVETTAVAGTEPTGWKSFRTAYTNRPSLLLNDTPVVEATKILTGSTRAHMVDQMGLLIEWITTTDRAVALSATTSIATVGRIIRVRAVALTATSSIATGRQVVAVRAVALSATCSVTVTPERDLLRSSSLSATSSIAVSGDVTAIHSRSASLSATTSIATTPERDLLRAASLTAASSIATSGEFESIYERAVALSAAGSISTDFERVLRRAVALAAASSIATAGEVESTAEIERSASLSATTSIQTTPQRVLLRAAILAAATSIATAGQRGLAASVSLSATSSIAVNGERVASITYGGAGDATYGGADDWSYAEVGAATYGTNDDWSYTNDPTATYGD